MGSEVGDGKGVYTRTRFECLYVSVFFKSISNWSLESNDWLDSCIKDFKEPQFQLGFHGQGKALTNKNSAN